MLIVDGLPPLSAGRREELRRWLADGGEMLVEATEILAADDEPRPENFLGQFGAVLRADRLAHDEARAEILLQGLTEPIEVDFIGGTTWKTAPERRSARRWRTIYRDSCNTPSATACCMWSATATGSPTPASASSTTPLLLAMVGGGARHGMAAAQRRRAAAGGLDLAPRRRGVNRAPYSASGRWCARWSWRWPPPAMSCWRACPASARPCWCGPGAGRGRRYARIQFTPDLMPSDVTGHAIFDMKSEQFRIRRGPVFCNLLLGDEINRAPAKTQAAMLEAMQEQQVTIEGRRWRWSRPSWCWRRRTRSSRRAPTRCPRRSSTAF
jgi:hypothetical protein